jgi:CheY-like chemotaxis protein
LRVFPKTGGRRVIKVLLAEDQTIVRRGIVALLALTQDIRVTAEASDGAEALTAAMTGDFDVALMNIRMPHLSGTQVIKEWAGMGKPPSRHFADHLRRRRSFPGSGFRRALMVSY